MPALSDFDITETAVAPLKEGELLLNAKYISVDPYMRGRMSDAKSYVQPFEVGRPLNGGVIAEVAESHNPEFMPGDIVLGHLQWHEQQVVSACLLYTSRCV